MGSCKISKEKTTDNLPWSSCVYEVPSFVIWSPTPIYLDMFAFCMTSKGYMKCEVMDVLINLMW